MSAFLRIVYPVRHTSRMDEASEARAKAQGTQQRNNNEQQQQQQQQQPS
jgi:hypothetical protein